ncbi:MULTISPECIES: hydroxyisourate hydrolase [unclassified Bradyrhizobium]|uniref:hydroxyisourate hydrolase n=1 Tax=unclassified Bradyrhizobium TaxID=2631580 RepID=UPI0028EB475F|nr:MULTISPECIES: hydroxyisourate hydrolase [unclassified Bradyrhizobium]
MGRLSTHILDTVRGKPAAGVAIDLDVLEPDGSWRRVKQVRSNADGRTDQPMLADDDFAIGTYMLTFHMGAYFRTHGLASGDPLFLDLIPLRFSVADAGAHYHVPLLATPWSYQTYRGS